MKRYIVIFCILFCVHGNLVHSQTTQEDSINRRLIFKNLVGYSLGGPSFLSINYEHYFNHNWSIEAGLGSVIFISGVHVGSRYYLGNSKHPTRFAPYLGAAIGASSIIGGGGSGGIDGYGTLVAYAPLGIQYISKDGFAFSLEGAGMFLDNELLPMGAIRLFFPIERLKNSRPKAERIPKHNTLPKSKSNHYNVGINLFSFIKPNYMKELTPDRFFSSNSSVDFFIEKEFSSKFALRFPIRIGFNSKHDWVSTVNQDIYRSARKTIIGDLGVEPIFYVYSRKKLTGLVATSVCLGIARNILKDDLGGTNYQYHAGGTLPYTKFGCSLGIRWLFTRFLQLRLEYGGYIANNLHGKFYTGLSGKCFLVYHFGGKKK